MKAVLISFLLLVNISLFGQVMLEEVNFERIPFKKVCSFINEQIENKVTTIYDLHPTLKRKSVPDEFYCQELHYKIDEDLPTVWKRYIQTSPAESWDGKRVSFGLLCSKPSERVVYRGGEFSKIDTGQVIFLNLRLLRGVYNLALAFEIIDVDEENKIVEFSYIEGNKSKGKQCLKFRPTQDGKTEIIHTSYFQSNSKVRDKFLYPFFHKRATNEFHRNMKKIIKEKDS